MEKEQVLAAGDDGQQVTNIGEKETCKCYDLQKLKKIDTLPMVRFKP